MPVASRGRKIRISRSALATYGVWSTFDTDTILTNNKNIIIKVRMREYSRRTLDHCGVTGAGILVSWPLALFFL